MRNKEVTRIVLVGLMLALEIILSRFLSISTPIVKIGFAFVPVVIVGMLYGWPWSLAVAALGDFIGAILFPIGPYFPGYTFSAALSGAFIGMMLYDGGDNVTVLSPIKARGWNKLLKCFITVFSSLLIFCVALSGAFMSIMLYDAGDNVTVLSQIRVSDWDKLLRCFIAALFSLLICSLLLDTLWLYLTSSAETVQGLLPTRLLKFAVMLPVQTFITYGLLGAKERLLPLVARNRSVRQV